MKQQEDSVSLFCKRPTPQCIVSVKRVNIIIVVPVAVFRKVGPPPCATASSLPVPAAATATTTGTVRCTAV